MDAVEDKHKVVLVHSLKNSITGFCIFKNNGDVIEIELIGVLPSFSGNGIGTELISYLLKSYKKNIRVGTQDNNERSIKLYSSFHGIIVETLYVYHYADLLQNSIRKEE